MLRKFYYFPEFFLIFFRQSLKYRWYPTGNLDVDGEVLALTWNMEGMLAAYFLLTNCSPHVMRTESLFQDRLTNFVNIKTLQAYQLSLADVCKKILS